jgi:hypothetical protein
MKLSSLRCGAVGLAALVLLVGCSKSSHGDPSSAALHHGSDPLGSTSSTADGSSAIDGSGDDSQSDPIAEANALCSDINLADAQALLTVKIGPAQSGGPLGCSFLLPGEDINGDNLTVLIDSPDADLSNYTDLTTGTFALSDDWTPISGIGDKAVWAQTVGFPTLVAHGSDVTCSVGVPGDASELTLHSTGASYGPTVTKANALAYVDLMGKVCSDVFDAAK